MNPVEARVERDWYQLLKLEYDEPLSNVALNFNLRPYVGASLDSGEGVAAPDYPAAGAYTRPLFGST